MSASLAPTLPPSPRFSCYCIFQCRVILDFWFFSWISFLQAVSNFFENSRRYSQFNVQMKKIFYQKNVNYFFGDLWEEELTCLSIFAFKFTLRCLQSDIAPIICHQCQPRRLLICHRWRWYRWQTCHRYRWHRWWICHRCQQHKQNGVVDTDGNFATGVIDNSGKFATSVIDTGGASWLGNISGNFQKNWNHPNLIFRGLGEGDSWKKP